MDYDKTWGNNNSFCLTGSSDEILWSVEQKKSGEMPFPSLFAYVPWGHHVEIITKCKTLEEAFFYIQKTIEEGLSRNALLNYLRADLFKQKENAITNYSKSITTKNPVKS